MMRYYGLHPLVTDKQPIIQEAQHFFAAATGDGEVPSLTQRMVEDMGDLAHVVSLDPHTQFSCILMRIYRAQILVLILTWELRVLLYMCESQLADLPRNRQVDYVGLQAFCFSLR